MGLEQIAFL